MEERPIKALLVEDDPDDAFLLGQTLKEVATASFDLVRVQRLAEGIAWAGEERFDVALLDLTLPDSSGLETFVEFHAAWPELPTVVLTGLDDEQIAIRAVHEGAQDYLVKGAADGALLVRSLRYAIERQRNTHYRALLAERERFDAAVSQMSDGIVVTDGQWRVTIANRAACLLLNLSEEDWRGKTLEETLQAFTLSTPIAGLLASHESVAALEISRPDTRPPLFIDARLSRLFDGSGDLSSTVLMLRDVTDERLSRHVRSNFFTMVPHKLRTPLAVLSGYLELTRHMPAGRLTGEWDHIRDVCEFELSRMVDIVQKLMDFESLSTWQLAEELRRTDVVAVVDEVVAVVKARYPEKNLEVEIEIAVDAARVDCTPDHLRFVLEQVVDNAAKFGERDPVRLRISAESDARGSLRFAVLDNGPGIPHEYFDRIFEGFVQVEERVTGQVPGLGVGLALARQIVEACGGSIGVQSTLGQGSVFHFTLPSGQAPRPALDEVAAVPSDEDPQVD